MICLKLHFKMSIVLSSTGYSSSVVDEDIIQKVQNISSSGKGYTTITGTTTVDEIVAQEVNTDTLKVNTFNIQESVFYKQNKKDFSFVPPGTIFVFAGNIFEQYPDGFLGCYGQEVSKTQYADLYNIIGNKYAYGRTAPTGMFYLPDLRGMFIRGAGQNSVYTNVEGDIFAGGYQASSVQKHKHRYYNPQDTLPMIPQSSGGATVWDSNVSSEITEKEIYANADTNLGSVRETRPHTIIVVYIIKY